MSGFDACDAALPKKTRPRLPRGVCHCGLKQSGLRRTHLRGKSTGSRPNRPALTSVQTLHFEFVTDGVTDGGLQRVRQRDRRTVGGVQ